MILITFNIHDKTRDKTALLETIKQLGAWWHHLETVWIVDTRLSPKEAYNRLAPHLLKADHILVIEIKKNYWGWLPKEAWEWFSSKEFS